MGRPNSPGEQLHMVSSSRAFAEGAELRLLNASAAKSLVTGLEETLTLYRLGLFPEVGVSFKATNALESIPAQVEQRSRKVDHWRISQQKQRWCAAALLIIELLRPNYWRLSGELPPSKGRWRCAG